MARWSSSSRSSGHVKVTAQAVASFLLLLLSAQGAPSLSFEAYLDLLDAYALTPAQAVKQLSETADRRSLENHVRACLPMMNFGGDASRCNPRLRALGALMHAETAEQLLMSNRALADLHFELSRKLAGVLKGRPGFTERWYVLITLMLLSDGDTRSAHQLALEAYGRLERSAVPFFLLGVIAETTVMFDFKNLRDPLSKEPRDERRIRDGLGVAAGSYGRALKIAPESSELRLRLGWTSALLGERGAEATLTAAAKSSDRDVRYLAQLFLGSVAERREDLERALTFYQAARDLGPSFHSACLATSQTLHAMGDQSRSREVAEACLDADEHDPWWTYRVGSYSPELLVELRQEAARQ